MTENLDEKPALVRPADEGLLKQLRKKLQEYEKRKAGKGEVWEYQHPELAHKLHSGYRDACYKFDVLQAVLEAEIPVDTQQLSLTLAEKYGEDFDARRFCTACGVVAHYCGCSNAFAIIKGGAGLPKA